MIINKCIHLKCIYQGNVTVNDTNSFENLISERVVFHCLAETVHVCHRLFTLPYLSKYDNINTNHAIR